MEVQIWKKNETNSLLMIPESKVHGANMGPIWGRQDPGGSHVGPMNFAIWDAHMGFYYPSVALQNYVRASVRFCIMSVH